MTRQMSKDYAWGSSIQVTPVNRFARVIRSLSLDAIARGPLRRCQQVEDKWRESGKQSQAVVHRVCKLDHQ